MAAALALAPVLPRGAGADVPPEPVTVAISDFETDGLPAELVWLGKSVADATVQELVQTGQVRIVERQNLQQLVDELKLQQSGLVDDDAILEIGRLLGARFFVFGRVVLFRGEIVIRARVASVQTGEVLGACEAKGREQNLFAIEADLGRRMAQLLSIDPRSSEAVGYMPPEVSLKTYRDLERLREICAAFPLIGLHPARGREKTEYMLSLSTAERIQATAPRLGEVHMYAGLLLTQLEDFDRANEELRAASALMPRCPDCRLAAANLMYIQRKYDDAEDALQEFVDAYPRDARGWYALARLNVAKSEYATAAEALIRASANVPVIPEVEITLKTILKGAQSQEVLNTLAKSNPSAHRACQVFISIWDDKPSKAEPHIPRALSDYPDLYIAYYASALLAARADHITDAFRDFGTVLSLRPGYPPAHREMALLAYRSDECALGDEHARLYMLFSPFVDDYDVIEKAEKHCR